MKKWNFYKGLVRGTTIQMLTSLEGQVLKERDCPSEIGTVSNYGHHSLSRMNKDMHISVEFKGGISKERLL